MKKSKFIWIGILILALILRLLYFRSATFFYDQARDAFSAIQIFHGDPVKIIGPTTDIPGVNHGPLFWYIIGPVYALTGGNILFVRFLLVLINLTGIFFIYDLSLSLFKNKKVGLLSSFLYATSFEAIAYGRWLSNPGPALVTTIISFWSLNKFISGKKWAIISFFASWAISVQLEIFMIYQIVPFAIIWLLFIDRKKLKSTKKFIFSGIASFFILISTYIISEFKFNFQASHALFNFFKSQNLFGGSFTSLFNQYVDRLSTVFFLNVLGINLFLAGLMGLGIIYSILKAISQNKQRGEFLFLSVWLFSSTIVNFFSGPNSNFVSLGILAPVIITTAYFVLRLEKRWKFLMITTLLIISAGNISLILSKNIEGDTLFTVQKQMILSDELKVIDWTYKEANGKPFKLNTFTQPLFINSTWAFLYNWYGKSTYGYMPIWWGEKQVDVAGSNVAFGEDKSTDLFFLIVEPGATGDDNFSKAIRIFENRRSEVIKSERIGYFTVEERKVTKNQTYTSGDVFTFIKTTDIREIQNSID